MVIAWFILFYFLKSVTKIGWMNFAICHKELLQTWWIIFFFNVRVTSKFILEENRATSSNKTTIRNKEQGSYWFAIQFTLKTNSCLVLYSVFLSHLRTSPMPIRIQIARKDLFACYKHYFIH